MRLKLLAQYVYRATHRRAGQRGLRRQPSLRHGGGPADRQPRRRPDQRETQDNMHMNRLVPRSAITDHHRAQYVRAMQERIAQVSGPLQR